MHIFPYITYLVPQSLCAYHRYIPYKIHRIETITSNSTFNQHIGGLCVYLFLSLCLLYVSLDMNKVIQSSFLFGFGTYNVSDLLSGVFRQQLACFVHFWDEIVHL